MTQEASYTVKDFPVDVGCNIVTKRATIAGNIAFGQAVTFLNSVSTTGLGTVTRSTTTLSADTASGTGNITRAAYTLTAATAGSFSGIVVGTKIIHDPSGTPATMYVTEVVSDTTLKVDTSGTLSAGTWNYQLPAFAKVYPGATIVCATGPTTVTVTAKASDFSVTTATSGTITTGTFTYANLDTIVAWDEDGEHGNVDAVAMDSFTYNASTLTQKDIQVKFSGLYPRQLLSTAVTAAGSVTNATHDILRARGLYGIIRQFNEF